MLSPAYGYAAGRTIGEIFLTRDDIHEKFHDVDRAAQASTGSITLADLPGFLQGERELPCTAWGNPDLQRQGLERPVLPDHRRALQDVRRPDDEDAVGELRPRQRPALRALHGALRLRAVGRAGGQREAGR